ncbi:MAG: recombinase family protein [Acidobacteriota bacterium]|nr:recombinase family protein [Acidobacteriota bacterium]
MRVGIYARVSTHEQTCENQLIELRRYCDARSWVVFKEYVDEGLSGSKDRRPALDTLLTDGKRRRFDVLVCWRLDRLGRNLRHLILLLDDCWRLAYLNIHRRGLHDAMKKLEAHRPAVAQALHTEADAAPAVVKGSDVPASKSPVVQ